MEQKIGFLSVAAEIRNAASASNGAAVLSSSPLRLGFRECNLRSESHYYQWLPGVFFGDLFLLSRETSTRQVREKK